MHDGTYSRPISQVAMLELLQRRESHVYALVTRHGAVKIGVTVDLARRKRNIDYGGALRFLAFIPGTYDDEQAIHASMADDLRLPGRREYYYPLYEYVLPPINRMREVMQLPALTRRDLPRTGNWANALPQPTCRVSWPWPKPWGEQQVLSVGPVGAGRE